MYSLLNKVTINAAAEIAMTNSKVGKQYKKCASGKLCNEVYVFDTIMKCGNCGKIKAL